jgi:hypothetical protein
MPDPRKHYLYLNSQGFPEAVDLETGEIVHMEISQKDLHKYRSHVVEGQRRWVPLIDLESHIQYSPLFADAFAESILSGIGIRRTCEALGVSYREYVNLRKTYPEFGELVDEARKDRAELFFDKIEEVAEQTEAQEDEIALGKMRIEAYKHLSEISDPQKFGKRTQISGKIGVGVIQIETGIRRVGDPGFSEAELFTAIEQGQEKIAASEASTNVVLKSPHKNPSKAE